MLKDGIATPSFNPPEKEVRVNSGFYFKSKACLRKIPQQSQLSKNLRPEMVNSYYTHGNCMCGKTDVDLVVVKMNMPVKYKFYNGKEIESDVFILGTDCIMGFAQRFKR